jgi:DNA-binding CsgD family transcriptional regulator
LETRVTATLHDPIPRYETTDLHDDLHDDRHTTRGAATALAPMVEVWFQMLADHVPDPDVRCRACTSAGTGVRGTQWPCSLRSVAELARERHAARWAGEPRPSRGRRRMHGLHGASCQVTPREREFLQHAADGRDDTDIAERLGVPVRTVRTTIRRIGFTLGVPDRTALLVLALRAGIVV